MIEWIVFGVATIHSFVFLFLFGVFRKVEFKIFPENQLTFSILIPVRNEFDNIGNLLSDISKIDFPKERFEVIIIDDNSEDKTAELVQSYQANYTLRYILLPKEKKGKKAALEMGVANANKDIILTTDGDCRVQTGWLNRFNLAFGDQTKLVVGPVKMEPRGLFGTLQSVDFRILIGYAGSLVRLGRPSMSNGANMAYRREVFAEVKGYEGNLQVPTGDDEFLLLKITRKYANGVLFLKDQRAVVSTLPRATFRDFLNQRKRWLSKWALHKNGNIILSVLLILIDNLAMLIGWIGLAIGLVSFWFLGFLFIRVLSKVLLASDVNKLLKTPTNFPSHIIYELIYPFYVLLLSFASIFGNYTWKGRKYK